MGGKSRRIALLLSSALAAALVSTGCSAGESTDSSTTGGNASNLSDKGIAQPAAPEKAPAEGQARAQDQSQAKDAPAQAPDLSVDQRSIVYRGSLSVRVKDVTAAAAQATGIASTAGGFLGADNRNSGAGDDQATMELRIPADKFGLVVDQLSKLGTEESRQLSTEDVTEQSIDLDARITVQQARVDSGRKLLAQAKSLSDLVMLEREVATRESDLASLQAKKRHVADLVALSTISVILLSPHAQIVKAEGPPGFLHGLSAGWHALLTSLAVLLTVLGAVLPWLIGLALPVWGIVYLIRRYRRTSRPSPVPAPAPAGGPRPQPSAESAGETPATG